MTSPSPQNQPAALKNDSPLKTRRQTSGLRQRAEQRLRKNRRGVVKLSHEALLKQVYELQVHQVQLEMQNEELRRSELALQLAQEHYSDLYDFAPTTHLTLDSDNVILEANLHAARLLGINRGKLIRQKFTRFISAEAQDNYYLFCRQVFASDAWQSVELELIAARGKRLIVHVDGVRDVTFERKQCRLSIIDITERRGMEENLRREKKFSESVIATAPLIILILDTAGRIQRFNPYLEQLSGYRLEEVRGKNWFVTFVPETVWNRTHKMFLKSQPESPSQKSRYPIRTKDGILRLIEWIDTPLQDAVGRISTILSIGQDITDQQQAEERVAKMNRVRSIIGAVDRAIVHLYDRQELLNEICRVAVAMGGLKLAWVGMVSADGAVRVVAKAGATGYLEGIHVVTQDVPEGCGPVGTAIRENRTVIIDNIGQDARMGLWRERAQKFHLQYAAAFPIRIAHQVVGAFTVYAQEAGLFDEAELELLTQVSEEISVSLTTLAALTARREAEEALRLSERNLAIFFNQAPIGLVWLSADGTILRSNRAQLKMLGYAASEYVGRHFGDFCMEPGAAANFLSRLAGKENIQNHRLIPRHKDGSLRHVLVDAVPIWSGDQFLYSALFQRDITDRIRLEQEILNVVEREHRRIAQDLHDGLGQLLVGAGYLTTTLHQDLAGKGMPEAKRLERIKEVINEAIAQARGLARGVHPVEAEPNGLMVALAKMAEQTSGIFKIRCESRSPSPVLLHDNMVATHLFRIAQEAVTNAIKHGKASQIEIVLTQTTNLITLAIGDNGTGLPLRKRKKPGMGLQIMRYRCGLINGSLSVENQPKRGTLVTCSVNPDGNNPPNPEF